MKCVKEESVRAFTNITIVAIGYMIQDAAAAAAQDYSNVSFIRKH